MPVFETSQIIRTDLETCWNFFSDPSNLSIITPPEMKFTVMFPDPLPVMHQGLIIRYRVSPLLNIPVNWITEITHVRKYDYFVDNQLKGPFRLWHHQHLFREVNQGIEIIDIVNYELPFGKLGELAALWMVKRRILHIFNYRKTIIESRFGN
ncbi:MAG: SRPBCC family protein [Bacteroidales bacterium]|nr:SRPBCC family protein [Bacteroidales bacterium]MBK9357244.1 SRPBCC family protein [Bacteroidales bacterium]